jgi:hypothetical protein
LKIKKLPLNYFVFQPKGDNVDFNEFKYNDIHIICSLLKLYLRQLPIPLITFDVYNRLIDSLSKIFYKIEFLSQIPISFRDNS